MNKADYVRRQPQTRGHTCHWPGCTKQVPPAKFACFTHWYRIPDRLRKRIWATYRQEIDGKPSAEYLEVAREVREWAERQEKLQRGES